MDPNEALKLARAAVQDYRDNHPANDAADALAEAFEALDGWLSKGGFLPAAWAKRDTVPVDDPEFT